MKVKGKDSSIFVCRNCGYTSAKWIGKCPECQSWNTLEKESAFSPENSFLKGLARFDQAKAI